MLVGGALSLLLIAGLGAQLSNYAWREAQWEELRAALRAAVSATAHLLPRISQSAVQEQVRQRVAAFLEGQVEGLDMDSDDVTVAHDAGSRTTTITIGGDATYALDDIWGGGGGEGAATLPAQRVSVTLDTERYEVAIAADISFSMGLRFSTGESASTATRLDGLKAAVGVAADLMAQHNGENPGSMAIALVPFGSAVNVADTAGSGATEGKRRYARMLTGAEPGSTEAAATTGHWVDTFHHYGTGSGMGVLYQQQLPDFHSGGSDWNLRAQDTALDVSAQVPSLRTWTVDGEDFWNGCVMARWGAYWHADARPEGWDDADPAPDSWPAAGDVAAWTAASAPLAGEPLHLSDAPPAHGDPNTRFTAYSWPDARIGGSADGRLEAVLLATLEPGTSLPGSWHRDTFPRLVGFNNWGLTGNWTGDGATSCPGTPILPLTDSGQTLRTAGTALQRVPLYHGRGMTYLHLGPVWGLRTLSPLWRSVWNTSDTAGVARPLATCAEGETGTHCDSLLQKTILLITDGATDVSSTLLHGRVARARRDNDNAVLRGGRREGVCTLLDGQSNGTYSGNRDEDDPGDFNALFRTESNGRFGARAGAVVQAIEAVFDQADNRADHAAWRAVVGRLTPWQLFRGDGRTPGGDNVNDLLADTGNRFGLNGRVVHRGVCRMAGHFGPYGQIDDLVQVGGAPVAGVAPLSRDPEWPALPVAQPRKAALHTSVEARLNGWFLDACRIADARGVSIRAIYIGDNPGADAQDAASQRTRANIARLEQCVDAAGGRTGVQDVFVTPDQTELVRAFRRIFTISRNLRFLD